MPNRLDVRRAFDGYLSRSLPIGNGLCTQARFGVVLRQQFGRCLSRLRKPGFQYLRNPLMILLARTLQEGLSGGVLNEGVLEHIDRLRWHTSLIDDLRLDQPS